MQSKHQKKAEQARPADINERILDIRYDNVFKAVFTKDTRDSRGALSHLISALIRQNVTVETIIANEPPIDNISDRRIRFDIACKTTDKKFVNIEMMLHPNADEADRLEFYAAKTLVGQDIQGTDRHYSELQKTYQIAIVANERMFHDDVLVHNFPYYDPENKVSLNGKSQIITLELCKIRKMINKPTSEMAKPETWAAYFEYLTKPEKKEKIQEILEREEGIAMAHKTLMQISRDEEEYFRQLSLMKNIVDYRNGISGAERRGIKQGRQQGLQQGRTETARNLKSLGVSVDVIAQATGLSPEEIALL